MCTKCCLNNTFESVVICLVGNSELHATACSSSIGATEADWLQNIGTFFILDFSTLGLLSGGALSIGSSLALGGIVVNRHLSDDGHVVGDDLSVKALPFWHLGVSLLVNKFALLKGLQLAVLIAGPHLLSNSVEHPLGVALLPGHVPADRHLVVLVQNLESILLTLLGGETEGVNTVVVEGLGEHVGGALGVANHLAILVGDGHTSSSYLCVAHSVSSVGADGGHADVVLDLTVPGDVDTLIIMTVSVVMTAMLARVTGHHQGNKKE